MSVLSQSCFSTKMVLHHRRTRLVTYSTFSKTFAPSRSLQHSFLLSISISISIYLSLSHLSLSLFTAHTVLRWCLVRFSVKSCDMKNSARAVYVCLFWHHPPFRRHIISRMNTHDWRLGKHQEVRLIQYLSILQNLISHKTLHFFFFTMYVFHDSNYHGCIKNWPSISCTETVSIFFWLLLIVRCWTTNNVLVQPVLTSTSTVVLQYRYVGLSHR